MWIPPGNESEDDITAAHGPQPATFNPMTKRKNPPATPAVQGFSISCDQAVKKIPVLIPAAVIRRDRKKLEWLRSHNKTLMKQLDMEHEDQ